MKKLNKTNDVKRYLQSGKLTAPFLTKEVVKEAVMIDFEANLRTGREADKIKSLMSWISYCVKYCYDEKFIEENQFSRTAKEIWESGKATGCTDYAIVFATLARQLSYACTILHTSESKWIERFQGGGDYKIYYGHSFCECFVDGRWILVDPTCNKIMKNYNPETLELDYEVLIGCDRYVPYLRNIDMGEKMTTAEYTALQEKLCRKL